MAGAGPCSKAPTDPDRGFTLIELLVVLAILALAAVIAPRVASGIGTLRLQAAADELADALRQLRLEAIGRGTTTELILDPAARSYTASTGAVSRHVLDAADAVIFESPRAVGTQAAPRLRFFADGSATGGTIRMRRGTRWTAITVDWLTGRVRRSDEPSATAPGRRNDFAPADRVRLMDHG